MEYITLKNTDLTVSRLCMGGCPMGEYGWGEVQERELLDAVNTAIDHGVNFFDTADTYGLGKSEENLGKALGGRRKEVIIASKFSVRVENRHTFYDNSPEWMEQALFASLKRLKTDYIDLYQIHYLDGRTPIDAVVEALEKMKSKGYIRFYGLCNIHEDNYQQLKPYAGRFATLQNEYSLACRDRESEFLNIVKELNVTPTTWGSLGQGILTGKYDERSVFSENDRRSREIYVNFHGEKLQKNLKIVGCMREIAEKHGVPVAAVAVRFILDHLQGSVVLTGAKRPSQIVANTEAMDWTLTEDEIEKLNQVSG